MQGFLFDHIGEDTGVYAQDHIKVFAYGRRPQPAGSMCITR
jgi:hypothetical protein